MRTRHDRKRIEQALRDSAERLDLVLIDRNARKGELPSDHAPVIADFSD